MTKQWYGLTLPNNPDPAFKLPENQVQCDLCGAWVVLSPAIVTPNGDFICAACDERADAAESACQAAVRQFEQDEYDAAVADGEMWS